MDSATSNHYEQQLYSVFKTFDVANEEALDRSAVLQLCDTLQLEDRGAALVDTLFERRADRVTFTQFRNGLLSVLGSENTAHVDTTGTGQEPVAVRSGTSPSHSDDDSSGREVAPKFVFGSKKYGRRSRPQRPAHEDSPRHRVASESRLDCARAKPRMRCKRSASAMESRDDSTVDDETVDLDHDRRVDRDRALALCRGLRMHGVDRALVDRIFETSSSQEISVGEFFDRLNASLTTSIAASLDGVITGDIPKTKADVVSTDAVVEMWERAGVQKPRRLLIELGFTAAALHPHELERSLEDELRALAVPADAPPDARSLLLLAAHVLTRMRLESAWRLLDVARAERNKLRDDLNEANRRARLLAQDVDDNHARIEAELKASVRQVETRHAEAVRASAAEAAAERERAAVAQLALEEETARRAETEVRLRTEMAALHNQIKELQDNAKAAEVCALQAEREQTRLKEEAFEAETRNAELLECERATSTELSARLHELRIENQQLRDRNDELCEALEVSTKEAHGNNEIAPSWREEVAMEDTPSQSFPCKIETHEISLVTKAKEVYLNEIIRRLQIIFNNFETLPLQTGDDCDICNNMEETLSTVRKAVQKLNAEMDCVKDCRTSLLSSNVDVGSQTELSTGDDAEVLRNNLIEVTHNHNIDKQNMSSVIKELESSLEQMKLEYDRCEEYWTCKLEDEREIFAEEQRAGDERLAELVAKIAEYEQQFARPAPPTLPPIAESGALEQQVTDLERELADYKTDKEAEVASKVEEIKQLEQKVEDLERRQQEAASATSDERGGERRDERSGERRPVMPCDRQMREAPVCVCACVCGAAAGGAGGAALARWRAAATAREAGALRARAARAERAAQRLHARLAAADLLVKDLYIENCRLAHLPHHPRLP